MRAAVCGSSRFTGTSYAAPAVISRFAVLLPKPDVARRNSRCCRARLCAPAPAGLATAAACWTARPQRRRDAVTGAPFSVKTSAPSPMRRQHHRQLAAACLRRHRLWNNRFRCRGGFTKSTRGAVRTCPCAVAADHAGQCHVTVAGLFGSMLVSDTTIFAVLGPGRDHINAREARSCSRISWVTAGTSHPGTEHTS